MIRMLRFKESEYFAQDRQLVSKDIGFWIHLNDTFE